jgi:hypothetical protein
MLSPNGCSDLRSPGASRNQVLHVGGFKLWLERGLWSKQCPLTPCKEYSERWRFDKISCDSQKDAHNQRDQRASFQEASTVWAIRCRNNSRLFEKFRTETLT